MQLSLLAISATILASVVTAVPADAVYANSGSAMQVSQQDLANNVIQGAQELYKNHKDDDDDDDDEDDEDDEDEDEDEDKHDDEDEDEDEDEYDDGCGDDHEKEHEWDIVRDCGTTTIKGGQYLSTRLSKVVINPKTVTTSATSTVVSTIETTEVSLDGMIESINVEEVVTASSTSVTVDVTTVVSATTTTTDTTTTEVTTTTTTTRN